jgi:hypothetical protein
MHRRNPRRKVAAMGAAAAVDKRRRRAQIAHRFRSREEAPVKRVLAATAVALFGLAPTIGAACEYNDASMASTSPPTQLGLAPAPAASKTPAPVVAKAPAPKVTKQAGKVATTSSDARFAAATTK